MTAVINTGCHNKPSRAHWSLEHPGQLSQWPLPPRECLWEVGAAEGESCSQSSGVRSEGRAEECGKEKLVKPHCCFYFLVQVQGLGSGILSREVQGRGPTCDFYKALCEV